MYFTMGRNDFEVKYYSPTVCMLGCTASKKRFTHSSLDLDLGFFFSKTTFLLVHFLSLCCTDDANFFIFDDDRHIKSYSSRHFCRLSN